MSDWKLQANTVDASTEVALSQSDERILEAFLDPSVDFTAAVPEDATPQQLWDALGLCARGFQYLNSRVRRIIPIIGQLMLRFYNRPSNYKSLGFETFADFRNALTERLGLSRSVVYEAFYFARQWPQVGPDRFAKIGPRRLRLLSYVADGRSRDAEELLRQAEHSKTVAELSSWLEQKGLVQASESSPKTIHIEATVEIYRMWRDFISTPSIQAYVGSKDPAKILRALMQECHNEWLIRGADKSLEESVVEVEVAGEDVQCDGA